MAHSTGRPPWSIPEREAAPEEALLDRRAFLTRTAAVLGLACTGALMLRAHAADGAQPTADAPAAPASRRPGQPSELSRAPLQTIESGSPNTDLYPATRNHAYRLDRPVTDELVAATSNNYYEFSTTKGAVWRLVGKLKTRPWTLEVGGMVEKPLTLDVDRLVRTMGLEERLYRLRCVEAWSIAVPWTGFPLRKLIEQARPLSGARYVRFVAFDDASVAPGQRDEYFPWPYYEALRMDEAMNELTMLATGIYGHELPKQHGAPIRLIVPWKYGFKSAKAIVRIELVAKQPRTFWTDVVPAEYDFLANVLPDSSHPRWSQAMEIVLGSGEKRPTLRFNGYAEQVAHMYRDA